MIKSLIQQKRESKPKRRVGTSIESCTISSPSEQIIIYTYIIYTKIIMYTYSMFIRRMQSLGFNASLLTALLAEVHVFCWNTSAEFSLKYCQSLLI